VPPCTPLVEIFLYPEASMLLYMSNGVFNFKFLALLHSEILGGSQIYTITINHNHNLCLMTADKTQHVYMRIITV